MAKARSFSIFLLHQGYEEPEKALKADHGLTKASHHGAVGTTWPTYVATKTSSPPWWRAYFGISDAISQGFAGAVVFVKTSNRTFALTFGHTRHHLRDEAYEYDFGLRTTLNAVAPGEIRNTDELDPATSRRRRTQLADHNDITYFDFDGDSAVLRSLTGAIRPEYKKLFSHATGASNLRVSSKKVRTDLRSLLEEIYAVYQLDTYLTAFPTATNIQPIKEPAVKAALDDKLLDAIHGESDDLTLTIPELMDFQEDFEVHYTGEGPSSLFAEPDIADYFAYAARHGKATTALTLDDLQRHRLAVNTDDGIKKADFSIYKSLVFETSLQSQPEAYHLSEGTWYRVDADYLKTLSEDIDPLFVDNDLPQRTKHLEADYNKDQLVPHWPGSVLLDKTSTSPKGQTQVEPCDVARVDDGRLVLTHVKLGVSASSLSHLFSQGTTSTELLIGAPDARARLKELIRERDASFDLSGLTSSEFKVEYVIATKNDINLKSRALPLFSRISLRRAHRALITMKTEAVVMLVEDAYVGTSRPRPRKAAAKKSAPKKATASKTAAKKAARPQA